MVTKLEINDDILAAAEQVASGQGQTLSAFVEQALREALPESRSGAPKRARIELPTFRGRGLQSGVNLDDSASLLDLMESSHAPG